MVSLDKNSCIPLYKQLSDELKKQIQEGTLKEADKILTEIELSEKYGISRITVRKAIAQLVEEGFLIKQQGVGTFVAKKKIEKNMQNFMGFTETCELIGMKASAKFLGADLVDASISDIEQLKLNEGDKIIRIRRLRLCDGDPVVIEENHFSTEYSFLLAEDLTKSLYRILRKHEITPNNALKTIGIHYATKEEAKLLDSKFNQALILINDIVYDDARNVIHTCRQIADSDKFRFVISS